MSSIKFIICLIWLYAFKYVINGKTSNKVTKLYSANDEWNNQFNSELKVINHFTAYFAWELSVNSNKDVFKKSIEFNKIKSKWVNEKCTEIADIYNSYNLNETVNRIKTLLCDGPKFTQHQTTELSDILYQMQETFTETKVCIPKHFDVCINFDQIWNYTYLLLPNGNIKWLNMTYVTPFSRGNNINNENDHKFIDNKIRSGPFNCFDGETDFDSIMKGDFSPFQRNNDCTFRFNEVFRWVWESWRLAVGPTIGELYPNAIKIMNIGAQNNGYNDIGEIWRKEIDIPDLQKVAKNLMDDIKPFYRLLHGILRYVLHERINYFEYFHKNGTIPAHILGSLFAQNWELHHELISDFFKIHVDRNTMNINWTTIDMVKKADDFYSSMGLPKMVKKFWKNSYFEKNEKLQKCHGTAANMYNDKDFRMIVCAKNTLDDFYVIIHEMGHIQYYMAYDQQPTVFQDANSALQESIGDAMFLAIMTPQHLHRLRLIPDKYLYTEKLSIFNNYNDEYYNNNYIKNDNNNYTNSLIFHKLYPHIIEENERMEKYLQFKNRLDNSINAFDLSTLLKIALIKIPQIPFEYILDVYRWDLFSGKIPGSKSNEYFWKLLIKNQGIHPPEWKNRKQFFDAGAKFHVADNTPFIRYFLASFLQAQIFRGLCEVTVFGFVNPPDQLPMPLHRCDIYGSKRAGNLLKKALKIGASKHWTETLFILTGSRKISADALLQYYSPLIGWLEKLFMDYDIPVGW